MRQVVQFYDGSRYLFSRQGADTTRRELRRPRGPDSIMLACDVLRRPHGVRDRLQPCGYVRGRARGAELPALPAPRLPGPAGGSARPGGEPTAVWAPLVPRRFNIGETG